MKVVLVVLGILFSLSMAWSAQKEVLMGSELRLGSDVDGYVVLRPDMAGGLSIKSDGIKSRLFVDVDSQVLQLEDLSKTNSSFRVSPTNGGSARLDLQTGGLSRFSVLGGGRGSRLSLLSRRGASIRIQNGGSSESAVISLDDEARQPILRLGPPSKGKQVLMSLSGKGGSALVNVEDNGRGGGIFMTRTPSNGFGMALCSPQGSVVSVGRLAWKSVVYVVAADGKKADISLGAAR